MGLHTPAGPQMCSLMFLRAMASGSLPQGLGIGIQTQEGARALSIYEWLLCYLCFEALAFFLL